MLNRYTQNGLGARQKHIALPSAGFFHTFAQKDPKPFFSIFLSPGLIIGHTQRKFPASGAATSRVIAYLVQSCAHSILALYNNTTCNPKLQVFFSKKWAFFQVCKTFHFFSFQGGFYVIFHKRRKVQKTASVCQKSPLLPSASTPKECPRPPPFIQDAHGQFCVSFP